MQGYLEIFLLCSILGILATREAKNLLTKQGAALVVDSCGLIDGRITQLIDVGVITNKIIIPMLVLDELQSLADGKDVHKRERARFGLEVAELLRIGGAVPIVIDTFVPKNETVDAKLIALCKKRHAKLYTTDYNLNKRAATEGILVINVNEVALSMRPTALPGDTKTIKIVEKGNERDQGVGYLEDGTMIVVAGGAKQRGKTVTVSVVRVLQSKAGKMMFARIKK